VVCAREAISPDAEDWDALLAGVRDLQILRPRVFGTIECRADPALPTLGAIEAQVSRRLAAYRRAQAEPDTAAPAPRFAANRRGWWALASAEPQESALQITVPPRT
jgi:hypothetical protein